VSIISIEFDLDVGSSDQLRTLIVSDGIELLGMSIFSYKKQDAR